MEKGMIKLSVFYPNGEYVPLEFWLRGLIQFLLGLAVYIGKEKERVKKAKARKFAYRFFL